MRTTANEAHNASENPFDILTRDTILSIFSLLNDHELGQAAQANSRLAKISQHSSLWAPRLKNRFHINASDALERSKSYYAELVKERRRYCLYLALTDLMEENINPDQRLHPDARLEKAKQDYTDFYRASEPTLNMLLKVAAHFNVDKEKVLAYVRQADAMLDLVLDLPRDFITQDNVYKILSCDQDVFPVINPHGQKFASDNERDKFARKFLCAITFILLSGCEYLTYSLLQKHPELPQVIFNRAAGGSCLRIAVEWERYDIARKFIALGSDIDIHYSIKNSYRTDLQFTPVIWRHFYTRDETPLYIATKQLVTGQTENPQATIDFIRDLLHAGANAALPCQDFENERTKVPLQLFEDIALDRPENKFMRGIYVTMVAHFTKDAFLFAVDALATSAAKKISAAYENVASSLRA